MKNFFYWFLGLLIVVGGMYFIGSVGYLVENPNTSFFGWVIVIILIGYVYYRSEHPRR